MRKIDLLWIFALILVASASSADLMMQQDSLQKAAVFQAQTTSMIDSMTTDIMQSVDTPDISISIQEQMTGSGYVPIVISPYLPDGNIDVMFGFNDTQTKPISLERYMGSYDQTDVLENGTVTTTIQNWSIIYPKQVKRDFDAKTIWYDFTDVPYVSGNDYALRMFLDVKSNGKYDVAIKPSNQLFDDALANDQLYMVDPFYNFSLYVKVRYTFNETGNNAVDYAKFDNNATATGAGVTNCNGFGGSGRCFDGSAYLSTPWQDNDFDFGSNNWTFIWFMNKTDAGNGKIIYSRDAISPFTPMLIQANAGGDYVYLYGSSTGSSWNIVAGLKAGTVEQNKINCYAYSRIGNNISSYKNGIFYDSVITSGVFPASASNVEFGGTGGIGSFIGMLDEVIISNGLALTQPQIASYCANLTNFQDFFVSASFINQTPPSLTSTNIFGSSLNAIYNIFSNGGVLDNNSVRLFYNISRNGSYDNIFTQGAVTKFNQNVSYSSNNSNIFSFLLSDDIVYPATYNFKQDAMENTPHLNQSIGASSSSWIKVNFTNISSSLTNNYIEFMASNTSSASVNIFYCNSSYTTGNPAGSSNCVQISTFPPSQNQNGTFLYSFYHRISLPVINGSVSGIGITPLSYILMQGGNGWLFHYITNDSGTLYTSSNNGNSYSAFSGTMDMHIHQFSKNDILNYWACANDSNGQYTCSTAQSVNIGFSSLPPTSPIIISPIESSYGDTLMLINYTAAVSITNNITSYTAYMLDSTATNILYTIASVGNSNLTYKTNTSQYANGNYVLKVTATDNESLSSFGLSSVFTIANAVPPPPPSPTATADAIKDVGYNFLAILLLLAAGLLYWLSFGNDSTFLEVLGVFCAFAAALFIQIAILKYIISILSVIYVFFIILDKLS